MTTVSTGLIGRREERRRLVAAVDRARAGQGGVVLVSGEAGIGKTRLVAEVLATSGIAAFAGRAGQGDASPYGPLAQALRAAGGPPADLGPLRDHLALVLPEIGPPPAARERATLAEAVRRTIAAGAASGPAAVHLDDLHWSDEATLDLLPALAPALAAMPVLLVVAYRSDGLARDNPVRRLRHELRRGGRPEEIALGPFAPDETGALAEAVLGQPVAPALAAALHARGQGLPFFVEELARALAAAGALAPGPTGLEMPGDSEVGVPETVRDAVILAAGDLSPAARTAADVAAVAGASFDPGRVARLADPEGLAELAERGWVHEERPDRWAFRHALTRDALHADLAWSRRRSLHARLAVLAEEEGAPAAEIAVHWAGAGETHRARPALMRAAREMHARHAYADAARAAREALETWPEGEEPADRVAALAAYGASAQLAGQLAEAARAWREVSDLHPGPAGADVRGDAERRLATVHELRGDRAGALAARRAAAEAYADAARPADAAAEHLAVAAYLRAGAEYTSAVHATADARAAAGRAGRADLVLRADGLEAVVRAKRGEYARGLALVRDALQTALADGLTPVAAELYQRLSLIVYDSGDYRGAEATLDTALALCDPAEQGEVVVACVTCMVFVLRECGEWTRATELARQVIAEGPGAWVAQGLLGAILAYRGRLGGARRLLLDSLAVSARVGHFNMATDSTTVLSWIAALEGDGEEAARLCHVILRRWERSEDHHYALRGLRWSAELLAGRGDLDGARACTAALSAIAARTGHTDALAALAHAIGEVALAEGDAATAAEQISRAADLHRGLEVPFDRAGILLRAGVALAAAGDPAAALPRLEEAYRTAHRLAARPLAAEAAGRVAALGAPVGDRLGRRAEEYAEGGGLSRRELEVVRLVAEGRTNREIAQGLHLSPRTVDMHVRNLLRRLGCRSRAEAVRRAAERGLLG